MAARKYHSIDDLYQTDLDRHLFAPTARRARRDYELLAVRMRDWLETGWSRWKALTHAWNFG